jgi:hypothetical protein
MVVITPFTIPMFSFNTLARRGKHDSDQNRRSKSRRFGIASPERQTRRPRHPRTDRQRFPGCFGSGFHQSVDFFGGSVAACLEAQVNQGNVDGRYADGEAVEFAFQVWQYQTDGFCCAGFGRNHVFHAATRLSFQAGRDTSAEEINALMKAASEEGRLKGVLGYNTLPLVSMDFNHTTQASTFDSTLTKVTAGKMVKVFAWYDNEWGFSCQECNILKEIQKAV